MSDFLDEHINVIVVPLPDPERDRLTSEYNAAVDTHDKSAIERTQRALLDHLHRKEQLALENQQRIRQAIRERL